DRRPYFPPAISTDKALPAGPSMSLETHATLSLCPILDALSELSPFIELLAGNHHKRTCLPPRTRVQLSDAATMCALACPREPQLHGPELKLSSDILEEVVGLAALKSFRHPSSSKRPSLRGKMWSKKQRLHLVRLLNEYAPCRPSAACSSASHTSRAA